MALDKHKFLRDMKQFLISRDEDFNLIAADIGEIAEFAYSLTKQSPPPPENKSIQKNGAGNPFAPAMYRRKK